jgi:hypothetical protein
MLNTECKTGLWIALVAMAGIVFSLALACVTPFAAIATVAGSFLTRRAAIALTIFAWLANQAVGYLVLDYPTTWDSYAWGLAIGFAALASLAAVIALRATVQSAVVTVFVGFLAAFAAYELLLFAVTAVLPSGEGAFSFQVVLQILWTNALALVGLLALHWCAVWFGLLASRRQTAGYA